MQELLDNIKIRSHIAAELQADLPRILIFNELPSTNDYLLKNLSHFTHDNVICLAESQTAGRGRLGRTWVSPATANIYLSLLWHFHLPLYQLAGLNMVIGISIVEAIHAVAAIPDLMLKWPNDVYWQDKKLAGILIDIAGESNNVSSAVIGIGINVNMPDSAANDILKPWVDLHSITTQTISRNLLIGKLVERLLINLAAFQTNGCTAFYAQWKKWDYLFGKQISISTGADSINGIAQGVNEKGQLLLQTNSGITLISAGEASVLLGLKN